MREQPRIAIIGGGFGGIAAGVKLLQRGLRDFTIFEKSPSVGGVWWDNQYPGVEVDTPSHMYSFSFMPYDWSRNYARQSELLQYANAVVDRFGLRDHVRLNAGVESVIWQDDTEIYQVTTTDGNSAEFEFVISAVGLLSVPRLPDWPGTDQFEGAKFHTTQWPPDLDLTGKTVALVGTGSTSVQVATALAPQVSQLYIFQREPGWMTPKKVIDYSPEERARFTRPWRYRWERLVEGYLPREREMFWGRGNVAGTGANRRGEASARKQIQEQLAGRPDLIEKVTPTYPFMGKRPIRDSKYFLTLRRPNVELVAHAVTRLTEDGIVDDTGTERKVDVVIFATGFQPSSFLAQIEVHGRDGIDLQEYWDGNPAAFLGITIPHFPNFFMHYGPNTNMYAILYGIERQAEYAARAIRLVQKKRADTIEVKESAYHRFKLWIDKRSAETVWFDAANYYRSAAGTVVTQWPDGSLVYGLLTRTQLRRSSIVRARRNRPVNSRKEATRDADLAPVDG